MVPLVAPLLGAAPAHSLAAAIMQRLAGISSGSTPFVEEKHLKSLRAPVVSRGELIFRRPAYLEKDTSAPRPERVVIDGNRLTISEASQTPRVVALDEHPALGALVATLRAALTGDLTALRRLYTIEQQGTIEAWRLMLVPIQPALRRRIARVTLDGSEGALRQIEIQEPNGDFDRLVLQ